MMKQILTRFHCFPYKKLILLEALIAYFLSPVDLFKLGDNREEKSLRHVAMVAKVLDANKPWSYTNVAEKTNN